MVLAGALMCTATTGCDDKLEPFEVIGSSAIPAAMEASSVQSEALSGEIKLKWSAQGDFSYMQIRYNDPLQKKDICKIVSKGTTEMTVENTRARFGDYTFSFQTFNAHHQGSAVTEVKAKSGAAPVTISEISRKEVALTAAQLSTNNQEPTEGHIRNLVDGKTNTFFHTRWSSPQIDMPQWIQVDFDEPHETFAIKYTTRDTGNSDGFPTSVDLQISNDGETWETVAQLSELPTKKLTDYSSAFVNPGKSFTKFRFTVNASSQSKKYFHMSRFYFYDVEIATYDPETAPLD